ncbi:MAG TPA: YqgE/AlgH family protein, partial [Paracoccaceae bacterium]|nr:YqgE/AlgH family protein [Paracoccaceae bacterium]
NMQDPRFAGSVICLCAHSPEGAMGIVVNRPIDGMSFEDLLKQLELEPVPPQRRLSLCQGGPVEGGRGFVLHTNDWTSDGSLQIGEDLALTASIDILKAIAGGGGPEKAILALGYSGWGPGQLEREIRANGWLTCDGDDAIIFGEDDSDKWRAALAHLGIDPRLLASTGGKA